MRTSSSERNVKTECPIVRRTHELRNVYNTDPNSKIARGHPFREFVLQWVRILWWHWCLGHSTPCVESQRIPDITAFIAVQRSQHSWDLGACPDKDRLGPRLQDVSFGPSLMAMGPPALPPYPEHPKWHGGTRPAV